MYSHGYGLPGDVGNVNLSPLCFVLRTKGGIRPSLTDWKTKMNKKLVIGLAALTLGIAGFSGCASNQPAADTPSSPEISESPGDAATDADLAVANTSLGDIVVDRDGMTVYIFDEDTADSGKSACSGDCLAAWPPVATTSESPTVDGVTGEVSTITRDDGSLQVALNGLPLYLYAPDEAAGDVTGQGVGGVWWVVGPDGTKIDTATGTSGY
jgi:predicted lipoprotein with Yx(FWY)xxD motif